VTRIPIQPKTIGDTCGGGVSRPSKLLQRDVAQVIGVDQTSIHNWEANTSNPDMAYMPALIGFLGYNPLPEAKTLADALVRRRNTLGFSQKQAARAIGVDAGMLAKWERAENGSPLPGQREAVSWRHAEGRVGTRRGVSHRLLEPHGELPMSATNAHKDRVTYTGVVRQDKHEFRSNRERRLSR
jgi:transcriptional regulator with XRE-family HTH domain